MKLLDKHQEGRPRRLIDDRCEKVVLALFEEALVRAKGIVRTPVFRVMTQTAVKAFFAGGADELLHDKIHKLAEYQDLTHGVLRNVIKSSTFTVLVT